MAATPSPAPDPRGTIPNKGFSEVQWAGYVALSDGKSRRLVADLVGRSPGTVSNWVIAWRKRPWGTPTLFDGQGGNVAQARNNVGLLPGAQTTLLTKEMRTHFAEVIGGTSLVAQELLLTALRSKLNDPDAMAAMSMADLEMISRIIERCVATSDRLSGTPHPDRLAITMNSQRNTFGAADPAPEDEEIDLGQLDADDDLRELVAGLGAFLDHNEQSSAIEAKATEKE